MARYACLSRLTDIFGRGYVLPVVGAMLFLLGTIVLDQQFFLQEASAQEASVRDATAAAASSRGRPIVVETSDAEGVTFGVDQLEPIWLRQTQSAGGPGAAGDPGEPAGELRYLAQFAGFQNSGFPGGPRLPTSGGWILVPPGTRPQLRVLHEQWEDAGGRLLSIEPTPLLYRDADGEFWAGEALLLPGEEAPAGATIPRAAVEDALRARDAAGGAAVALGEVATWRGRRIVPYTVVPVQSDGSGRAQRYLRAGRWEVRFTPEPDLKTTAPPAYQRKLSNRGDDRFAYMFLNGEQVMRQPTEAAVGGWKVPLARTAGQPRTINKANLLADEVRLAVERSSLHRVTAERLISRGLLPSGMSENQIRLYQRRYWPDYDGTTEPPYIEIEVPIHMVGDGGTFGGDDFFLFYGLRLRDDVDFPADLDGQPVTIPGCGDLFEYNNEFNVYWLAAAQPEADESWARMSTATLPAAVGVPLSSYPRNDHFEERVAFRENVQLRDADRIYNNDFNQAKASMNVQLWTPAGGLVQVSGAASAFSSYNRNLHFTLTDGTTTIDLGDYEATGITDGIFNFSFSASAFTTRDLDLEMVNIDLPSRLFSFLNWAEFSYEARFEALSDQLVFNGGSGDVVDIEVSGFSTADIGLVDLSDPRQPVYIDVGAGNVVSDAGEYKLSIRVDQSQGRRTFQAEGDISTDGVVEFHYVKAEVVSDPINPAAPEVGDPDLIVITHPEFRDALQPWLDHRQARAPEGLRIHTVEVQDLYDWYNGGLKDQWAIKRFVDHAIAEWGSWALMFVGDANENALELGVGSTARPWSQDWVPTHLHVQNSTGFQPELLASDKWYAIPLADDSNYPNQIGQPTDMYVGRFPCNSTAELTAMINKTILVEDVQPEQLWRRRGIFMADDAWSTDYNEFDSDLAYHSSEEAFGESQRDYLAYHWRENIGVDLEARLLLLDDHLHDFPTNPAGKRDLTDVRAAAEVSAMPDLFANLNDGALIVHYQGHGNAYVLAHEWWIRDRLGTTNRQDLDHLANTNRPFIFFGMGCHLADWAQNTVHISADVPKGRSISEKMLIRDQVGAYATYGSSGFEYLNPNKTFSQKMIQRWMLDPPTLAVSGENQNSRWVLGELMWASESDQLASNQGTLYRQLVAQYTLLGDPLMVLDCGAPEVDAVLLGSPDQPLVGGTDLVAIDASNLRSITMSGRDEAGIDRIVVRDSGDPDHGPADLTASVVTSESSPGNPNDWNRQMVDYELSVPIRPFDHVITVDLFDTADRLESDDHYQLVLNVRQEAVFLVDGEEVPEGSFEFQTGVPINFTAQVTSAAWLSDAASIELVGRNLTLSETQIDLVNDHELALSFTATLEGENAAVVKDRENDRAIDLTIDGYLTTYVLESSDTQSATVEINSVYCYPNPVRDQARFVFETGAPSGAGKVLIYAVSGRPVADLDFSFAGQGRAVVVWNGRDNEGDSMANGVYLYQIVLETAAGRIASDMQRLVMMQ